MRWKSFLTNSTDKAMSNDANKLKNRQEIRKYLVFAGMFLLFIGCMWWIFAPSEEDRQEKEKNAGFNTELPDPRGGYRGGQDHGLRAGGHETQGGGEDAHAGGFLGDGG